MISFAELIRTPILSREQVEAFERGARLYGDDRQPLPQGDRPMLTPHEAAVARLKELNRAAHPELEELLAVVRMYPVEIQRACEAEMKRGADASFIDPIKAVADQQAVEIQELLDALTSPGPMRAGDAVLPGELIASGPFKIGDPLDDEAADDFTSAVRREPGSTLFPHGSVFVGGDEPLPFDKIKSQLEDASSDRALDDLAHEPPAEHPVAEEVHEPPVPAALESDHPAQ